MIKIILKSKKESGSCPKATQDLELNTKNRNSSIKAEHIQYGPLNLSDEDYWMRAAKHWNTTPEVAKKSKCGNCTAFDVSPRMLDCLPGPVSEPIEDEEGKLGYCWMHHFKCHSARTCYTWAAGGPISKDDVSYQWQEKSEQSVTEAQSEKNYRGFTMKKENLSRCDIEKIVREELSIASVAEKKDDRCTRIAKRKYDAWPSAYASGAVVRCRAGKIWKDLKETDINLEENTEYEQLMALEEDEGLRKWFGRKGAPGKTGGWVDCNTCRKDPKTGKKISALTPLKNKEHPLHKRAKGMFQRVKDKFNKKKSVPKKQSKSDVDFYKKQFTGEVKEGPDDVRFARRAMSKIAKDESKLRKSMFELEQAFLRDPRPENQKLAKEIKKKYKSNVTAFMRDSVQMIKRMK